MPISPIIAQVECTPLHRGAVISRHPVSPLPENILQDIEDTLVTCKNEVRFHRISAGRVSDWLKPHVKKLASHYDAYRAGLESYPHQLLDVEADRPSFRRVLDHS